MTIYSIIFYLLAALIVISTGIAITRKNMVHVVVYIIISFFGTAMLFYLFGAPILALLQIIIYAGAIMVLFLFIIMMLKLETTETSMFPVSQWVPAAALCAASGVLGFLLLNSEPNLGKPLETAIATPSNFGYYLFKWHWLSIELVSILLLIALVGALHLGKAETPAKPEEPS
jgi:NADH-quinone oxidoreductase subunit J